MVVVVSLIMLIITITAISNNVTAVHDGTYRVVIPSRHSAPQLSQQIPTDGHLACNKPAVQRDGEGTAAEQLVHMVLPCRQVAILWQFRKQTTSVANYGGVPVSTSVANNCGVPMSTRVANNCGVLVCTSVANKCGMPVSTSVANNCGVPVSTSVANNGGVPVSTRIAKICGVPISTRVANNCGVPVSTSVANNGDVPVSTSINAHSTHLHLSHPSALQPFVSQLLLLHPLLPCCLQSIYHVGLHPLRLGRLCF